MSALTILQVSDTHLSPSHAYFQDNWDAFVDCVAEEKPDFVFVTGDMCFNGPVNPDDLAYARGQMDRLPVPWRAIPGNHDIGDTPPDAKLKHPMNAGSRAAYRKHFDDEHWVEDLGEWRFVGLNAQLMDSGLPGEAEQMAMLEDALATAGDRSRALIVHKPLFNANAGEKGRAPAALFPAAREKVLALCGRYGVRLVASGHRHCYRSLRHGRTQLVWAPATAFIDTSKSNDGLRLVRRLGYVRYRFEGRKFSHALVEPPRFINHDLRNWMLATGSTTHLPPRPLAGGA
ncbi:MAG: metallophosphoesterase family protein [Alphaproteobacteria bacterium]